MESTWTALERHYTAKAERLVRFTYLLVADAAVAEDIVQEAFARAFGRFRHLSSPERCDLYIKRTIVNLARDHYRKKRRLRLDRDSRSDSISSTTVFDDRDALRKVLEVLPIRQRTALVLRHYVGLTEGETAIVLNTSVAATRSLCYRALETLRSRVEVLDGR